jgi:hypothetical protein
MLTFRVHWFLGSDCDDVFANVNVHSSLIPRVRLWWCIRQCQRSYFTDSSGQIVMMYSPMSTFIVHWILGSDCDVVFPNVNVHISLNPRVRLWCCIPQCQLRVFVFFKNRIFYNILEYNICMYSIVLFFKCRLLSPLYGICRRGWRETRSKAQTGMDVSFCTITLRYLLYCLQLYYILDHQQVLLSHQEFMCIVCN